MNSDYDMARLSHYCISRRGIFRSLLQAGRRACSEKKRAVGRPPQAIEEDNFILHCTACGACVSACPYGLISIVDGLACLQIDFSSCDTVDCCLCTTACPSNVLLETVRSDTSWRPVIDQNCLGRNNEECRLCQQACPTKALYFDENRQPKLENNICDGCGKCKISCLYGHITLEVC